MSNSLAIAAVTETLRKLLDDRINADPGQDPNSDPELAGTTVTVRPPDRARTDVAGKQVNLFLYHTEINAAWRNMDMPRQVRPGENGRPPLPLNLFYLLTAYSPDDDDVLSHRLLGRAMSVLHDNALLNPADVQNALAGSDLYQQIEGVRVIPQSLSLEELSKLWATFQTQYRVSTAYRAAVVLIESTRPVQTPLPVLQRGQDDRGPAAVPEPSPTLTGVSGLWTLPIQPPPAQGAQTRQVLPPGDQPLARRGETIRIRGRNLRAEGQVRFDSPRLESPFALPVAEGDAPGEIKIVLADPPPNPEGKISRWLPGFYTVSLVVQRAGLTWTSNEIPFMLAPQIAVTPNSVPAGNVTLTITCQPRLRAGQESRVLLLFGERQIPPANIQPPATSEANPGQPTTLTFQFAVTAAEKGTYTLRLRVDGVDSLPFAVAATSGPAAALIFDPQQQVTIT